MTIKPVDEIVRKIRDCRRLAVTSHLRPDGDSLCSGLALVEAFEGMGKTADYVITDPIPVPFNTFSDFRRIRVGQLASTGYDAVVLLECADVSRSGQTGLDGYFKINIDHHYSNSHYADINWVDAEAPAVAELVLDLCETAGLALTPSIANHLYCAIVSDTGSFQFSNTTARAFAACHKLVLAGARPIETSEAPSITTGRKIILLGRVLRLSGSTPPERSPVIGMFRKDLIELDRRSTRKTSPPWGLDRSWASGSSSFQGNGARTSSGSASGPRARPTRPGSPNTSGAAATPTPPASRCTARFRSFRPR